MTTGLFGGGWLERRRDDPSPSANAETYPPLPEEQLLAMIDAGAKARRDAAYEAWREEESVRRETEIFEAFPEIYAWVKADDMDELARRRELATAKTYLRRFRKFEAWSAERGYVGLPYKAHEVALYLLLSVGCGDMSVNEAKLARTAIAAIHEKNGHAPPCKNSLVKAAIRFLDSLPPDDDGDGGKPVQEHEKAA